jgi:alkylation response protein AidB-like acyl-CoA dehydrogenase
MTSANGTNGAHGNAKQVPFRNPAVYSEYAAKWRELPGDETAWLRRAQDVADVLAVDAVVRDQENKSPRAEISLLKHAGLLKILGPKKYGGGEQPWSVGYKVIRKVAEADGYVEELGRVSHLLSFLQVHRHATRLPPVVVDDGQRSWD